MNLDVFQVSIMRIKKNNNNLKKKDRQALDTESGHKELNTGGAWLRFMAYPGTQQQCLLGLQEGHLQAQVVAPPLRWDPDPTRVKSTQSLF